ncbi:MAG: hypothetical protein CMO73_11180 [Verrucomicrobiales bacterium]|nr:hypothetical protein [Verrucomicrobiales bacterium]HAA87278.1 hypothetical protein [Verrucomicrobiales bacterium]
MSLKKFHILFISLSTLCLVGFGIFCILAEGLFGDLESLKKVCGVSSIFLGIITSIYGVWFYRNKIKHFDVV